jgi:hypothetical protein
VGEGGSEISGKFLNVVLEKAGEYYVKSRRKVVSCIH